MGQSLSFELLQTLRRGADSLSGEARQRVCAFVESRHTESEAFVNRGGQPDLYYTLFGWMLCYALNLPSDNARRKAYLLQQEANSLDGLHQSVLKLCQMLHRLLALPYFVPKALARLMADDYTLTHFFRSYMQHGSGSGTNAWAARLAIATDPAPSLKERLLAMQHPSGGFLAHEGVAMPDLLSTAVALYALRQHNIAPHYDARPFMEAHWQEDGSFAANLLEEQGDTEYEFYGLLALGAIE